MDNRYIQSLYLFLLLLVAPLSVWADAIGTWKLYPCYSDVKEVVTAGDDVFVLASGNLYSYNTKDNSITEYNKTTCLSTSNITHIAWVQQAKRLVVVYSDYTIDLLQLNQDVLTITDLRDKQMTGDKTINDIYVNGKYAYLSTGFGVIKLNVAEAYISDTYNLGFSVNYCYIEGGYIYAESSSHGNMQALLTSNLLDKNNWTRVGNYTARQQQQISADGLIIPDSPSTNNFWRLTCDSQGVLFCADGQYDIETAGRYMRAGNVKKLRNDVWTDMPKNIVVDSCGYYNTAECVAIDPSDNTHVFVGAFSGLYEFRDNVLQHYYNRYSYSAGDADTNKDIILSLCFDKSGNLWVVSYSSPYISMLAKNGTWTKYHHPELLNGSYADGIEGIFMDSRNLLWFCSTRYENGRVFCFNPQTDVLKRYDDFTNEDGTTYTPWMHRLREDNKGNVWIATNTGPFYVAASDILGSTGVITQYKVPRNDGTNYADYLLTGIDCKCIYIDDANRKWIGTASSGVYVISSDCNTEIHHFTAEDSPLPSNTINDITADPNSGIIYIATADGLCSYQSDKSVGDDDMSRDDVYAYPNPVTPDFTGMITIVGLASGAQIKITTSSGQLVNEGICSGGSYQWNGCDLSGRKVASGVYMVNVATSEGKKGVVTKIGIVR